MNTVIQATFDYQVLDTETQDFVQGRAKDIHVRLKRTAEDIIAIGQALIEVKTRLGHGQFGAWIQTELGMTDRTARNFMNVASRFGDKTETVSDLPATVLYLLAAPSTPDEIVDQVVSGEIPATKASIKEAMSGDLDQIVGPSLFQVYQETGEFDKARSLLWTGLMLRKMFESMESMDELLDFAWDEYRLHADTAMEFMTYADRYPNPNSSLTKQVRRKLEDLYDRSEIEMKKFLFLASNTPRSVHAILLLGRKLEKEKEEHSFNYSLWLKSKFQIEESVADTIIGYADQYRETPIDSIPEESMNEMVSFCAQYKLLNVIMGTAVFLDLPSQQKSSRSQWPPLTR